MAGLIDDSLDYGQQATRGLADAADMAARRNVQNLEYKRGIQEGIGQLAGVAGGIVRRNAAKKKSDTAPLYVLGGSSGNSSGDTSNAQDMTVGGILPNIYNPLTGSSYYLGPGDRTYDLSGDNNG